MREATGIALVLIAALFLVIAGIAALSALVQLARGRREAAKRAGSVLLVFDVAGMVTMCGGGLITPSPAPLPSASGEAEPAKATDEATKEERALNTTHEKAAPEVLDVSAVVKELEGQGFYSTDLEKIVRCEKGAPGVGSRMDYLVLIHGGSSEAVTELQANVYGYAPGLE